MSSDNDQTADAAQPKVGIVTKTVIIACSFANNGILAYKIFNSFDELSKSNKQLLQEVTSLNIKAGSMQKMMKSNYSSEYAYDGGYF